MCMKPLSAGSTPTHPRLRQQHWRRTIPWRTGEKPVDHSGRTGRILLSLFTDYQVTGKVPEMRSFSFSSVNKHRPHFQFSLLPARSCTQVVCNSHIPSCFWRVSEALRHWGLPVTFFFVFELLFLCSVFFRGSLLSLFYVTREFNTEDELDIACVCGTLQFYNLQVVAWFWSFMFWFSSSADYLRLDHTGRQYTDVIKLYHIFIILYSPLILV